MSDSHVSDDLDDLALPDLGDDVEGEGVDDDAALDVAEPHDDGGDPFDDAVADDVPIEYDISITQMDGSAIGDDTVGVESSTDHGVSFDEGGVSMIDEGRGHAEEGLDEHGDDELGIDPIPREVDDGGLEGLPEDDQAQVDTGDFPPLDGDEDDDVEIDVGIEIAPSLPEAPVE